MADGTEFIVDASYILSFLMPDESDGNVIKKIESFVQGEIGIYSSLLLPYEVGNALNSAVKRKRITREEAQTIFETYFKLHIPLMDLPYTVVLELSLIHGLSFYDASYICAAQIKGANLLTLDSHLMKLV